MTPPDGRCPPDSGRTNAAAQGDDSKAATLMRPRMAFVDGHLDTDASLMELVLLT